MIVSARRRVVASLRRRLPALPQQHGGEREREQADWQVDEEDPLPARPVDERAADQPGGRRADPSERAPDAERLVPLGPLREERGGMIESAVGVMIAAPIPWNARAPIRASSDQASPQRSDANVKKTMPTMNTRRRPRRSAARPPSSSRPAKVSAYALTTHCSPCAEKSRSSWIEGRATVTIGGIEDDHEEGSAEEGECPPAARIGGGYVHDAPLGSGSSRSPSPSDRPAGFGCQKAISPPSGTATTLRQPAGPSRGRGGRSHRTARAASVDSSICGDLDVGQPHRAGGSALHDAAFQHATPVECVVGVASGHDLLHAPAADARVEGARTREIAGVQLEVDDWARGGIAHRVSRVQIHVAARIHRRAD